MSPRETSSNIDDMHTLLHELNSLNEMHVPDHTELFGVSVPGIFRNAANSVKGAFGHTNAKSAAAAETAWSSKTSTEVNKRSIMKGVLQDLVIWIDTCVADDVVKLKQNLYHMDKVDQVWITRVNAEFTPAPAQSG
jgi:hypothetical protein